MQLFCKNVVSNERTKKTTRKKIEKPVSKKVEKADKSLSYGLYKVKNKFVFDTSKSSTKPEDEHLYVVFTDKNNNVDRIVGTTHLYEKEKLNKIELKVFSLADKTNLVVFIVIIIN